MVTKLHALQAELRLRMHEPVADVGAWLQKVVNGYYRYHAVPGNIDRLSVLGNECGACGGLLSAAVVNAAPRGIGSSRSLRSGFQFHVFYILIL